MKDLFDFFIDNPVGRFFLILNYVLVSVALHIVCGIFDPSGLLYIAVSIGVLSISAAITVFILYKEGE